MAELDRERIATEWAARGFSCDLWTDPPGQRWDDFRHATDELIIVLEGQMEFEVAGEIHLPELGQELLIPAGAVHSARDLITPLDKEGKPDPKGRFLRPGAAVIYREDGRRMIAVSYGVAGQDESIIRAEALKKTEHLFKAPYRAAWGDR